MVDPATEHKLANINPQILRKSLFFKQWGGVRKKKSGRLLDGRTHDEIPERLAGAGPVPLH